MQIRDASQHVIASHPEHCMNQVAGRLTASGEIVVVFNEERFPIHHDGRRRHVGREERVRHPRRRVPGGQGPGGDAGRARGIDWSKPGPYQHIGYPSVVQTNDGTIVALYHEWNEAERPLQEVRCTRFRLAD